MSFENPTVEETDIALKLLDDTVSPLLKILAELNGFEEVSRELSNRVVHNCGYQNTYRLFVDAEDGVFELGTVNFSEATIAGKTVQQLMYAEANAKNKNDPVVLKASRLVYIDGGKVKSTFWKRSDKYDIFRMAEDELYDGVAATPATPSEAMTQEIDVNGATYTPDGRIKIESVRAGNEEPTLTQRVDVDETQAIEVPIKK